MLQYTRSCQNCNNVISYTNIRSYKSAVKKSTLCHECSTKKFIKDLPEYCCPKCNIKLVFKSRASLLRAIKIKSLCRSCRNSIVSKNMWESESYRRKITESSTITSNKIKDILSASTKKQWQNPQYKANFINKINIKLKSKEYRDKITALYATDTFKTAASNRIKKLWLDDNYRNRVISRVRDTANTPEALERSRQAAIKQWQDPTFKQKMALVLANQPKVSNIQQLLYSMLDDLKVKYFREYNDRPDDKECQIGPYSFDCVIPGDTTLLIECQGNYWHSLPNSRSRDKAKASYIADNFPNHRLKYIWEHEFYNYQKVITLLKTWLGIEYQSIQYDFNDIIIKQSSAVDYKELLTKYHYLPTAGKGGVAIGAYLNDILIAVAVFSPPSRQNTKYTQSIEISRLCVHPLYRKKNLISWFLSRVLKLIKHRPIVAYADKTFNHTGACYKASGFVLDGVTLADYWYVDEDGWVMHKKTLYNRAVNIKLTESEFASQFGYTKIYGHKKFRFLLH